MGWTIAYGPVTFDGVSMDFNDYNVRHVIPAAAFSVAAGTKIRITLSGLADPEVDDVVIVTPYIAHAAASGDFYDFIGTPVALTFDGNDYVTIWADATEVSDDIDFAFDGSKDLVLSHWYESPADCPTVPRVAGSGTYYGGAGSNQCQTVNPGGYSAYGYKCLILKIEVYTEGVATVHRGVTALGISGLEAGSVPLGIAAAARTVGQLGIACPHRGPAAMGPSLAAAGAVTLCDSIAKTHRTTSILAGDPVTATHRAPADLSEKDSVVLRQRGAVVIGSLAAQIHTPAWDIYLDGVSIKNQVLAMAIRHDQAAVHNDITFTAMDHALWRRVDPDIGRATARLAVAIDGRTLTFMVEDRAGDNVRYTVSGRSLTALDDDQYAAPQAYATLEARLASDVAASILSRPVTWQAADWLLPDDFWFEGAPVAGVKKIAAAVGAVVRSTDTGDFIVRPAFPVRPHAIAAAAHAVNYDRYANLLKISYTHGRANGYDAVQVNGHAITTDTPQIDVEETGPVKGATVHLRVYWPGAIPAAVKALVTAGQVASLGRVSGTETETVVFVSGRAELSRPPVAISKVTWRGANGGTISCTPGQPGVTITKSIAVGEITYTTAYQRYRCMGHFVPVLVAAIADTSTQLSSVYVKTGTGANPAPAALEDDLLTGSLACMTAGAHFIDTNKYDSKTVTIRAPYDAAAVDGALAYINEDEVDCVGNHHIMAVDIMADGPALLNTIEVIQWKV
jgi:hypothetical protein